MPIWLRNYTFNKIKEWYNPENPNENSWVEGTAKEEALKNKQVKIPTYITKTSKK